MAKRLSRRDFIKISSAGVGGLAIGGSLLRSLGCGWNQDVAAAGPLLTGAVEGNVELTPTVCEMCFWKCAGWVHAVDGQPWKITGNPEDPNCNGRLCPRGTGGIGAYLDNDRLRTPLIRTTNRYGKQVFREATWDEALNHVAERMKKIADEHGPECMALFTHGSGGTYFKHLMRAFGSNNIAAPSYSQCRGPREEAYLLTFGEGVLSPERTDIRNTKCLVLIGSHIGENMHNTQVQEFADAVGNGATVIAVDPRYSVAASKAKYWLPIRPSTDLALLLAWINVIVEEELYDKEYVRKYTYGFRELKESIRPFTPEWAYPITTIKPNVIRETAREMAWHKPATIVHPGRHVTWYGDDTQRVRAGAILNALLGSWGRRGGFYFPNKAHVPKYKYPKYPQPKKSWKDAFPEQYPLANLALASGICDATIPTAERNCSFKGWLVYGTNLLMTLPQPKKTLEAIQNLELMVAIDLMPAEITGYADVVLPECSYLERYDDIRVSPGREPAIALRAPAFKPRFNSKPGWWIARELGLRLGLEKYFPWKNIEEYLETRLQGMGLSLDELKKKGVVKLPKDRTPLYLEKGVEPYFDTPTGKIELYSTVLANHGFDPIPRYTEHEKPPEGYFRLLYGRTPTHTFGRTTNNPVLTETMQENEVWINSKIAEMYGIKNGEYVVLVNQDGVRSNKVRAKVTQRIRHDCVFLVHGFGHDDKRLTKAFLRGANDNQLVSRVNIDPIMGGTGMRVNFVTFEPVNQAA